MKQVFVKVTGNLKMKAESNVLADNNGLNVVAKLDIENNNSHRMVGVYEDENDMKCVKTGAWIKTDEGTYAVDIFMYSADLYVHEDAHRGYYVKARELNK
jgi:hypothetical protein